MKKTGKIFFFLNNKLFFNLCIYYRKKHSSIQDDIEKQKVLGKKRRPIHSRLTKQMEDANNNALLDLDLLHECVSPPTELSEGRNEGIFC